MTEGDPTGRGAPTDGFPRPIGFGEAASISWHLYRLRFAALFPGMLAAYLLLSLTRLVIALDLSRTAEISVSLFLELVAPMVVAAFLFAIVAIDVVETLTTSGGPVLPSLRSHRRDLFLLGLTTGVLVFALLFLLGPMVTLIYPMLMGPLVFVHVLVIERMPVGEASRRARQLLARHWSRVVLYMLTVGVLAGLLAIAVPTIAADAVDAGLPDIGVALVFLTAQGLVWTIALPFVAIFETVVYLDLRARKEDLDLNALRTERDAA